MKFNEKDPIIIDLSNSKNVTDMVFSLGKTLETEEYRQERIVLQLGDIDLERPQMLGLKSLIIATGSVLVCIHTTSSMTKLTAMELDITVFNENQAEEKANTIKELVANSDDVLSEIITENENRYNEMATKDSNETEHDDLLDSLMSNVQGVTQELERKLDEETLNEVQCSQIAPVPPLEPVTENTAPTEEIFENFNKIEQIAEQTPFLTSIEEKLPSEEPQNIEETPANAYISDIIEPHEDLLEKEFLVDENTTTIEGDTIYIKQTLRSGQVVSFDGNVIIIGDCHHGSEIIASGDIIVWGVLEGIAHAGSKGNQGATIRALKIDALQLRIANYFARRPDRPNIELTEKTGTFTPEEAKVKDGGIFIYTLNKQA